MNISGLAQSIKCNIEAVVDRFHEPEIITKIIFPVANMEVSIPFYESLGFEPVIYDSGYVWLNFQDRELFHLRLVEDLDVAANRASGYFHVLDAVSFRAKIAAAGEHPTLTTVEEKPWGLAEFSVEDPSGNLLRFGSPRD